MSFLKGYKLQAMIKLTGFLSLIGAGFFLLIHVQFDLSKLLEIVHATDPIHFLLLMCFLPLIGFPIAAFYLYAGTAFPWWQATALCSLALAINMTLAYPIAKYLLQAPMRELFARYIRHVPTLNEHNQFRAAFLVRSIPGVPFTIQNYLLPLLGVKFPAYLLISWSIQSVFAAGMAAVPKLAHKTGWIWFSIILFVLLLLLIFKRYYLGKSLTKETSIK